MISTTIQNLSVNKQYDSTDKDVSKNMFQKAFRKFLDRLIRDNYKYDQSSCDLRVSELSFDDKKIFLTYLINIEDYEDYAQNENRLRAAISEYEDEMQYLIDERISDVWHEDMREMGAHLSRYSDNDELRYNI